MEKRIQLGIIGYGGMGSLYARFLPSSAVNIVAATDTEPTRVQNARNAGLIGYDTVDELLADPNVNTVILSVPNHLHKEMCIKAAKAGKHVIDEKPSALTVAELDEMDKACKEAGVVFTVHQNRRWDKDMLTAKHAFDNGTVGNIFAIESRLHSGNGHMHDWHLIKEHGGGMMYDWGVHFIDQILFMMPNAKIKMLWADLKYVLHDDVDDYFKILMKMDNGITAHMELSTYMLAESPRWIVAGDKGTMVVKNFDCEGSIYTTNELLEKLPPQIAYTSSGPTRQFAPMSPDAIKQSPLPEVKAEWAEFFINVRDAIYDGAELKVKIPEVRRVLAVIEAVFKSAETGEAIGLEQ
ncbi:MAG: Gfo/Idh/MocA family oxidoreductase [Defluviitaleaceae bacterium]|nr:Gfo/Idh/MocA family oxidoreductase [Defluviitaleaceae bacterium]